MSILLDKLPDDPAELKRIIVQQQAERIELQNEYDAEKAELRSEYDAAIVRRIIRKKYACPCCDEYDIKDPFKSLSPG